MNASQQGGPAIDNMVKSPSASSLLGGSPSAAPLVRKSSHGGPNSRLSTHMFVAQAGPVLTGVQQSVDEYRTRKVALITGQCAQVPERVQRVYAC